jgi:DNA-binding SARP family transcriptional activator/ABC-type branched-subunit amino acid transport system substrate-binding protein/DNA-binding beta-propeller fold protein YncE
MGQSGLQPAVESHGNGMEFRILGPLEVSEGGRRVELGGRKQRALLASLLLHANEVVSADRLIDELWGETPPPTAPKTLQAHVSRLRQSLNGDEDSTAHLRGPLETRGPGYVLKVEPDQLDADRFQRLLEDARRALARGKPGPAAENAEEALALWRGPALADFAYEAFAQADIARLDELRLSAQEERIEAELALGRHRELVGELEQLVSDHPLRERLRSQLMLALYRSDRQAEALQVYQQGRLALAEELGLEPSRSLQRLERQILEQDPALAAPASPAVSRARRRVSPLVVLGALVLAAAVGAVAFLLIRDGDPAASEAPDVTLDGSGVVALDPRTGAPLAAIPLGTAPSNIAVGEGAIWVLDADDRTVSRIDPQERAVRTFSAGSTPTDLAAGAGAVWIGNGGGDGHGSFPASVLRVDPESGVVDEKIVLPGSDVQGYFQGLGLARQFIAVTDDAVWVVNPDQTVSRIDPLSNRIVARVRDVRAWGIAAGEGGVWVIDEDGVAEIDPETSEIAWKTDVAAEGMTALAVGGGAVWAADPFHGSVWRIDPGPDSVQRTIPLELGVNWVAFGEGAVWATNEVDGTVHRIDPGTNRAQVVSRLAAPGGVAVGERGVWVTSAGQPSAGALPASACRDVYYAGAGDPRFLIVSNLPLQGIGREMPLAMVGAIRFVLERRGFRAGPYTVGYQSCDESTAQADGTDLYRCLSNATAYALTPAVLGVIGALQSHCSSLQIPIANQAPGGPLAMISPANTLTFVTRPGWGTSPEELEELYPSGERNYVRIAAADHFHAPALVEAARQLGATRVAVLSDRDDPYVAGQAADMRERAEALGLELVDSAAWNPYARRFDRLARRVAATRPDAVLLAGAAPPHLDSLLADLRASLGRDVALIAREGFVHEPAPAARGVYVGHGGIPNAELPPAGLQFLEELKASGGKPGPDLSAVYGAQAAEILLDAIARSDGTRASVAQELFRTRVEDGLLGDIRFDRYGDLVEGPVTIYRITRKGPVVDRVITVTAPPAG